MTGKTAQQVKDEALGKAACGVIMLVFSLLVVLLLAVVIVKLIVS